MKMDTPLGSLKLSRFTTPEVLQVCDEMKFHFSLSLLVLDAEAMYVVLFHNLQVHVDFFFLI